MGYVFDYKDALTYERWFYSPKNRNAAEQEARLVFDMLKPGRGRELLDIGCGTGARLADFVEKGLNVSGVDPSPFMLDICREKFQNRVEYFRNYGEDLPFEDNAFHYSTLITTLEYVDDASKVIQEACRVTKDRIFIGIYNRYSVTWVRRRIKAVFSDSIYRHACFYSVWDIKQLVRNSVGNVPVAWKTVCRVPEYFKKTPFQVKDAVIIRKIPVGSFAGIVVSPVPRLRTTPLALKYDSKHSAAPGIQPLKLNGPP
ncbi:MAG: class I SAM-dependent methyltransferase [Desulfobacterales bacterium]